MSYDPFASRYDLKLGIEGSPDHWWVTTAFLQPFASRYELKGHQIIGELRPFNNPSKGTPFRLKGHQIIGELRPVWKDALRNYINWRVTRSLVSYDQKPAIPNSLKELKGHQIIGELRLIGLRLKLILKTLKGHQIIGELRPNCSCSITYSLKLKGHQIIGELRPRIG